MRLTIGFLGIPSLYLTWWNIPVIGGLAYLVVRSFYRLFLHPLRHFPGPRLRALSSLPHASSNLRGMLHHDLATLHRQYGEVVRIAPDHLSFISAEAWKDIYGHAAARKFLKVGYGEALPGVHSIVTAADPETHTRQRRLISHAFSDTALREQEEVVIRYVDLLVKTLKEKAAKPADAVVNLVRWFDFTTFDLIGDLSFGESFGCLDVDAYHPWVETLLQILMAMAPKKAMEIRDNHTAMSMEKVHRRLKLHTNRADFWKYILRHQDDAEKSMSLKEMEVNASTLIIAGSETISTTCSGVIFFLSHQPLLMKELCDELRTTFKRDDEINMTTIGGLKVLHATLMEGMRLFPPAPAGAPRLSPPGGAYVAGSFVAGGTTVMISQLAAYTYPPHFKNPLKFDPSRWLGNPEYDSDNKDVYQPFSMGPRNCVGKNLAWIETKVILAKMLWNFDFELLDDNFEPQRQKMYILWQKPELRVRLKVRPGI